ncbi:MAG: hypothetical protein JRJ39_16595 [Deltaproteobacteria bacterium]|nr:hypothetical protein [Deltaproteobacteria bacterium]
MNEKWKFIEIEDPSNESLDRVGQILSEDPSMNVHVSIFKDDDQSMAAGKAVHVKNYIIGKFKVEPDRVHTSWFRQYQKEAV